MTDPENEIAAVRAVEMYNHQREARFRNMVQSVVNFALRKHGEIDPDHADREVYHIAMDVASVMLARVYEEDAELKALRSQVERYRKGWEESIILGPMPRFLTVPK